MSDWQPIETAPKDGSIIMAWVPDEGWPVAVYWAVYDAEAADELGVDGYWSYADHLLSDVMDGSIEPTYWMPLPEPPQS